MLGLLTLCLIFFKLFLEFIFGSKWNNHKWNHYLSLFGGFETGSPYSSSWSGTCCVDQSGLELRDPFASSSWVLGLKVCATLPGLIFVWFFENFIHIGKEFSFPLPCSALIPLFGTRHKLAQGLCWSLYGSSFSIFRSPKSSTKCKFFLLWDKLYSTHSVAQSELSILLRVASNSGRYSCTQSPRCWDFRHFTLGLNLNVDFDWDCIKSIQEFW